MTASLDQLEREVENARARLATDLARLRDPNTVITAKEDLLGQARGYKDEAVERVRQTVTETVRSLLDEVRLRVEQNPAAALVVGAGLAWRLAHKPPIASLLVAAGVASLLNTSKASFGSQTPTTDALIAARDSALDRAERISNTVQTTSRQVSEQARRLGEQIRGGATDASAQLSVATTRAVSQVGTASDQAVSQAAAATSQALEYATEATEEVREQIRDNPLYFGAAALAVGAALGLAMSRSMAPASE